MGLVVYNPLSGRKLAWLFWDAAMGLGALRVGFGTGLGGWGIAFGYRLLACVTS